MMYEYENEMGEKNKSHMGVDAIRARIDVRVWSNNRDDCSGENRAF